jgi:hypothetical protein
MYRSMFVVATALGAVACQQPEPELGLAESAVQALACSDAEIAAGRCRVVPPLDKVPGTPGWAPFVVDGVLTPTEYWGAVELPYANIARGVAGGHVLVNVSADLRRLNIFLDDLPGSPEGELRVYLDHDRFREFADTDPAYPMVGKEDRAYGLDLGTGAVRRLSPQVIAGVLQWAPLAGVVDYAAHIGAITGSFPTDRFDAELSIPIDAVTRDADGHPGIGFAVAQVPPENGSSTGACPEALVIDGYTATPFGAAPIAAPRPRDLERTRYETLVFGVDGHELTFVTWNVKRFTDFMEFWEGLFNSDALPDGKIDPALIGAQLGSFDVVALEEAWSKSEANAIRDAANVARAAAGLAGTFQLHGPIDFAKTSGVSFDSTTGGVYVMSPYPVAELGWKIFDDCRGEDCLKAKGVLHARLLVNRITADDGSDAPPRSTDEFVDVYATHLQADQQLCAKLPEVEKFIAAVLAGLDVGPIGNLIAKQLFELVTDAAFHCDDYKSDADVRARQLAQIDRYIAATSDPTRPSVVMGDFNIDGRRLNRSSTEYGTLLDTLELGPVTMDPLADAPDDHLTPWPDAFDWDLDHADLGREQVDDATWLATGLGTFVGADGLDDPAGTPPRLDYIFVRPPGRPGSPAFDRQSWIIGRGPGEAWASPWFSDPSAPTVGNRLSDHKPVIASLLLMPLRMPDRYHATWPHHLEFHVTEANAAGNSDCIAGICGGEDLYSERKNLSLSMSGVTTSWITTTMECSEDGSVLDEATNACVATWGAEFDHVPGVHRRQGAGNDLWEADAWPNPDDHYRTVWDDTAALFLIDWPTGQVLLRRYVAPGAPACIDGHREFSTTFPFVTEVCDGTFGHRTVADNSDQSICSRNVDGEVVPFVCYRLHWEETPP